MATLSSKLRCFFRLSPSKKSGSLMKIDYKTLGHVSIEHLMIGSKRKLSMDGFEDNDEGKRHMESYGEKNDGNSSVVSLSLEIQSCREL
ncbi:hypothetical protein PanWU01x14_236970 [Parasponia andersonii]|uniref:Uncharacterized protein n=1 Tax=Parasponia andersonii TaxID=3476 RepID=A0A2P5BI75_PARAD|nr:hypothetical protein PanWU01x14_236970 [Parasponia andersonii]